MKHISFGTSGHRGIIGETFTSKHVEAIVCAIAYYVKQLNPRPRIVIGYDPRNGNSSELAPGSFTKTAVDCLLNQGIDVDFFDTPVPTPVVSWYIQTYGCDGGIILTASHNPADYNGLKFNPANGAPAPSELTAELEDKANQIFNNTPRSADLIQPVEGLLIQPVETESNQLANQDKIYPKNDSGKLNRINKTKEFSESLIQSCFNHLKLSPLDIQPVPIAIDAMHGTAGDVWDTIFSLLAFKNTSIIHQTPLPDFGGIDANPTHYATLSQLRQAQKELNAPIAFANDPDSDRHVILDESGNHLLPEETAVIILEYLLKKQAPIYGAAATIACSRLVKNAAVQNRLHFEETAVGFKYFASFFETARQKNQIALGVESSGGFSASFHSLEKCGFLPCLMVLLISLASKKSVSELKREILDKYGASVFLETKQTFEAVKKPHLQTLFRSAGIPELVKLFDQPIKKIIKIDGLKVVFTNQDWVLMRLSGTEPLARIYVEAKDKPSAEILLQQAKLFIG
ncbi:hypothetical protein ACFL96_01575 [Thermoproteota archaeon]